MTSSRNFASCRSLTRDAMDAQAYGGRLGGTGSARRHLIPALDDAPPEPYVRESHSTHALRSVVDPWHIAVRVLGSGQTVIRCQLAPLSPPVQWRAIPPEVSLDEVMCWLCLIS
jgi:hypothetical protein